MLVVLSRAVHSGEAGPPGWECQLCAPDSGWEIEATAGAGYVVNDEYYFGDYSGLDDDGVFPGADLFARYWSGAGDQLRIEGYRLGLDSRAVRVKGDWKDLLELRASYQGIPVRTYDNTTTPYRGNGSDRLTLPSNWVRAPTTQGMTQLDSALQDVKIKQDWDIYTAGLSFTPARHWDYDVDYRRIERDGQDIYAGSFLFNTAEFTRPIDYHTDEVTAKAGYTARDWQLALAYSGSFFDNASKSLTWENAYSPQSAGQDSGQLALPPDNHAHQITLSGSLRLPARTTVNAHVSVGRMKQDDKLLPYTTNQMLVMNGVVAPLPENSVNGEVDTTNIEVRAASSPVAKFTVDGRFRYNQRDNKTPERTFDYVLTDFAPAPVPVMNTAYDYDRYDYELGGEYRFTSRTRFHAGLEHQNFKRSDQERKHTRTDRLSTRLDSSSFEILDLNFEIYAERRDGSDYESINNVPDPQNPRMRLYNMSDRDRHGAKSYLSLLAGERGSIGINFEASKDEYKNVPLGLKDSSYTGFGFDLSWLLARDVMTYATTHWEQSKAKQDNSQNFSTTDWKGKTNDKYFTTTLGLKYPHLIRNLAANIEYSYAKSTGDISNDTSGLESEFPTVKTRFHQLRLGLEYPYNTALSLKFGYLFQKYSDNDWALDGVSPDTVPNLLSLGAEPQHYTNHVFFIGVKYAFDSRDDVDGRQLSD